MSPGPASCAKDEGSRPAEASTRKAAPKNTRTTWKSTGMRRSTVSTKALSAALRR
nr:hypothetical protein [Deltaproteobacteria bacterium]